MELSEVDTLLELISTRLEPGPLDRNGFAKKPTPPPGPVTNAQISRRRKIAQHIHTAGPQTLDVLAKALGTPKFGNQSIRALCNCSGFHINADNLVSLTSYGEKTLLRG